VTHLRKMMLEELQRRNYAETTLSSYIRRVEDFSLRFQRPPDRLGPKHSLFTQLLIGFRIMFICRWQAPWLACWGDSCRFGTSSYSCLL